MDNAQENGSADNMKRPSIIFLKLKSLVHAMHYNVHNKSVISQKVKSRYAHVRVRITMFITDK